MQYKNIVTIFITQQFFDFFLLNCAKKNFYTRTNLIILKLCDMLLALFFMHCNIVQFQFTFLFLSIVIFGAFAFQHPQISKAMC